MSCALTLAVVAAATSGCASRQYAPPNPASADSSPASGLALPSADLAMMMADSSQRWPQVNYWEFARNDAAMGRRDTPAWRGLELSETIGRDRLRTINGRPRESSTTSVRTIRRHVSD